MGTDSRNTNQLNKFMPKRLKYGGRKKGTPNKNSSGNPMHMDIYEKEPFVYLVKANDRYKIGFSTNLSLRFKHSAGLCPYPIELIHLIKTPYYKEIERGLHKIFNSKRVHYEWFLLSEIDVESIKRVKNKDDLSIIGGLFNHII